MTNKERFKANIRCIELEPHSYCNRKCWFCPNSSIDRTGAVKFMDQRLYLQMLSDLASIDYSEVLLFAGWCEPFSQPDFVDRVKDARKFLPHAMLMANTNTDYLTSEVVRRVANSGLDLLRVQLYFDKDEEYTKTAIETKACGLSSRLSGINFVEKAGSLYAVVDGKMLICVQAKDFSKPGVGVNRCDLQVVPARKRYHTCMEGVQYFGINYNGMTVPCCQIRSDYPPHRNSLNGQMTSEPGKIFELYQGVVLPEDRYPCTICLHKQSHANIKMVYSEILKELKNG